MALSGNKGEWSEIYALFRLLGEGKVHAGDADMNKLDLYYPILNVIREVLCAGNCNDDNTPCNTEWPLNLCVFLSSKVILKLLEKN